jgi:hypothetical protein
MIKALLYTSLYLSLFAASGLATNPQENLDDYEKKKTYEPGVLRPTINDYVRDGSFVSALGFKYVFNCKGHTILTEWGHHIAAEHRYLVVAGSDPYFDNNPYIDEGEYIKNNRLDDYANANEKVHKLVENSEAFAMIETCPVDTGKTKILMVGEGPYAPDAFQDRGILISLFGIRGNMNIDTVIDVCLMKLKDQIVEIPGCVYAWIDNTAIASISSASTASSDLRPHLEAKYNFKEGPIQLRRFEWYSWAKLIVPEGRIQLKAEKADILKALSQAGQIESREKRE